MRPEGPRRDGVLGEGAASPLLGREQLAPSPPARGSGERCKLPSGVRGEAQAAGDFGAF